MHSHFPMSSIVSVVVVFIVAICPGHLAAEPTLDYALCSVDVGDSSWHDLFEVSFVSGSQTEYVYGNFSELSLECWFTRGGTGSAPHGFISMSLPSQSTQNFTTSTDMDAVSVYEAGDNIWTANDTQIPAQYVLVDASVENWGYGHLHYLRIENVPFKQSGVREFFVRAAVMDSDWDVISYSPQQGQSK